MFDLEKRCRQCCLFIQNCPVCGATVNVSTLFSRIYIYILNLFHCSAQLNDLSSRTWRAYSMCEWSSEQTTQLFRALYVPSSLPFRQDLGCYFFATVRLMSERSVPLDVKRSARWYQCFYFQNQIIHLWISWSRIFLSDNVNIKFSGWPDRYFG